MTRPLKSFPPFKSEKERSFFFKLPKPFEEEVLDDTIERFQEEFHLFEYEVVQNYNSREIHFLKNCIIIYSISINFMYNEKGARTPSATAEGYGITINKKI
jgi:hypothetical protein